MRFIELVRLRAVIVNEKLLPRLLVLQVKTKSSPSMCGAGASCARRPLTWTFDEVAAFASLMPTYGVTESAKLQPA